MWARFNAIVAVLIAVTVPLGVLVVNGFLPFTAIVLGIALGLAYWCWWR